MSDTTSVNTNILLAGCQTAQSASPPHPDLPEFSAALTNPSALLHPATSEPFISADCPKGTVRFSLDKEKCDESVAVSKEGNDLTVSMDSLQQPSVAPSIASKEFESDDTDELLAAKAIDTQAEFMQQERRKHTNAMAKELVDGILLESLVTVSVGSAINIALADAAEDGYYSEGTTSSERSFHELVGVSSQIFLPDGTPLNENPLKFNDPPQSLLGSKSNTSKHNLEAPDELLLLRSEEVILNGTEVKVISVPWDTGVASSLKPAASSITENLKGKFMRGSPLAESEETETDSSKSMGSYHLERQPPSEHVIVEEDVKPHMAPGGVDATPALKDVLGDSAISSDWTEDVICTSPGAKPLSEPPNDERVKGRDPLPSDSGHGSEHAETPPPQVETVDGGANPAAHSLSLPSTVDNSDYNIDEEKSTLDVTDIKGDRKLSPTILCKLKDEDGQVFTPVYLTENSDDIDSTFLSPRSAQSSEESIMFVFLTRSYSADEVNNASSRFAKDISIEKIFGCDTLSTDTQQTEPSLTRQASQSEPNLFVKPDSPRSSESRTHGETKGVQEDIKSIENINKAAALDVTDPVSSAVAEVNQIQLDALEKPQENITVSSEDHPNLYGESNSVRLNVSAAEEDEFRVANDDMASSTKETSFSDGEFSPRGLDELSDRKCLLEVPSLTSSIHSADISESNADDNIETVHSFSSGDSARLPQRGELRWIEQPEVAPCATLDPGPTLVLPTHLSDQEETHDMPPVESKTSDLLIDSNASPIILDPSANCQKEINRNTSGSEAIVEEVCINEVSESPARSLESEEVDEEMLVAEQRQQSSRMTEMEALLFGETKPEDEAIEKYMQLVNQVSGPSEMESELERTLISEVSGIQNGLANQFKDDQQEESKVGKVETPNLSKADLPTSDKSSVKVAEWLKNSHGDHDSSALLTESQTIVGLQHSSLDGIVFDSVRPEKKESKTEAEQIGPESSGFTPTAPREMNLRDMGVQVAEGASSSPVAFQSPVSGSFSLPYQTDPTDTAVQFSCQHSPNNLHQSDVEVQTYGVNSSITMPLISSASPTDQSPNNSVPLYVTVDPHNIADAETQACVVYEDHLLVDANHLRQSQAAVQTRPFDNLAPNTVEEFVHGTSDLAAASSPKEHYNTGVQTLADPNFSDNNAAQLHRSWASQTDVLNVSGDGQSQDLQKLDVTTMTNFGELPKILLAHSPMPPLKFDMQTSTTDLAAKTDSRKRKSTKLASLGKLSKRPSRSSIKDVLAMLREGLTCSGCESVRLFDAALAPPGLSSSCGSDSCSSLDSSSDALKLPAASSKAKAKGSKSKLPSAADHASRRSVKHGGTADAPVKKGKKARSPAKKSSSAKKPAAGHKTKESVNAQDSTEALPMPGYEFYEPSGTQMTKTHSMEAFADPLFTEGVADVFGKNQPPTSSGADSAVSPRSQKGQKSQSRKAQIQELLNSVDATLARYGSSVSAASQVPRPANDSLTCDAALSPRPVSTTCSISPGVGSDYLLQRSVSTSALSSSSICSTVRDEQTDVDLDELDRLRKERHKISQILGKDYLPSRMWMELAEAQLNYAFGQTDTLLEALDAPPTESSTQPSAPKQSESADCTRELVRLKTQQLQANKSKIEERIAHLEQKASKSRPSRPTRSSSVTSLAKARRQAEIEIFKLEREREENYMRSKAELEQGSDTMSICSATSNVSSASAMAPREHLRRLTKVRKQVVSETTQGAAPTKIAPSHPKAHNKNAADADARSKVASKPHDDAIEVLRRKLSSQQNATSASPSNVSSSHRPAISRYGSTSYPVIKTTEEIERQIDSELANLSKEFSNSGRSYSLHDNRVPYRYGSGPSLRTSVLSTGSASDMHAEPFSYRNSSVTSLARTISQIRNYGVASTYRPSRRSYY
ncbi:uncharacterized protein [Watersipora subatra]|uniref:uncharacterized protein n=1 Tax=Watersipora subatra TaxID=2589382 RepID=UPI00355B0E3B